MKCRYPSDSNPVLDCRFRDMSIRRLLTTRWRKLVNSADDQLKILNEAVGGETQQSSSRRSIRPGGLRFNKRKRESQIGNLRYQDIALCDDGPLHQMRIELSIDEYDPSSDVGVFRRLEGNAKGAKGRRRQNERCVQEGIGYTHVSCQSC